MTSRNTKYNAEVITDGYNHRVIDALGQDVVKLNEDFVNPGIASNAPPGWTATLVGSSTVTATDASGGKALVTTGATENNGVNLQKNGESFQPKANSIYFGVKLKISDATQSDFFVGLSVTDTGILGNLPKRIGFRKVDGETGISFECEETNTTQVTEIATIAADSEMELEFEHDQTAGKLFYYVDGTPYGPLAVANIPNTEVSPAIHFLTGEAAAKTMTIDWLRVFQFGRN